jgi:AP-1 complex subunit beta-1
MLQAAKDVVLADKPTISDDSHLLDPALLEELLGCVRCSAFVRCLVLLYTHVV